MSLRPGTLSKANIGIGVFIGLLLSGCDGGSSLSGTPTGQVIEEAFLSEKAVQIGGATTAAARADMGDTVWAVYNMANRLAMTPIQTTAGAVHEIELESFIQDILVVPYEGRTYALAAVRESGIAVVDITNPAAMQVLHTTPINYYQDGITYAEGGGDLVPDVIIEGHGFIKSLETDGTDLWIADESFGIHRTALSNLLTATPVTEDDGTLKIDAETYTLQYSGEHPWGAPADLQLHSDGRLYAAIGFLGLGIYDPDTLERVGYYNLYTDDSVTEDWFLGMDVDSEVQPGFIDPDTGMPDYNQASFEIQSVWHDGVDAPTPWADFDRYGKYYYKANALDVETYGPEGSERTTVYMAYGLAGIVAIDVNPTDAATSYLGYAPAVPAHGPDEPTGQQSQSLFPYFGVGMLKEAGVIDVEADLANNRVFYADHFAGLVALDGADSPEANWQQGGGNFDNDDNPLLHWPDYEFVTSYDMGAWNPDDNESLPIWMYEAPSLLVSGEVSGHGNALFLMPTLSAATDGVDVVQATGAGGLNFMDLGDLTTGSTDMASKFTVPAYFASTTETFADAGGSPTSPLAIGHTQGVATTGHYLYLADGPHGMSVWKIADANGNAMDEPHVVANTVVDEYEVDNPDGSTVFPTPHAYNVILSEDDSVANVMSQSLGLRRVDISSAEAGQGVPGAPMLLTPQPSDFYEHNLDSGSYGGIKRQDHAYDVDFHGDYAVVADGSNGLTVYDMTMNPADGSGNHVVANLGAASGNPLLGRASGVELWTNPADGKIYAFVASGHSGIAVVDMTELLVDGIAPGMELVKIFQPIKIEEELDGSVHIGKADSRSVDVDVIGNHAYFSYGGFGLLAYSIDDLLEPLPAGVDPTKIWTMGGSGGGGGGYDYRPEAVAQYRLQTEPGLEDSDPEALYMTPQYFPANKLLIDGEGRWFTLDEPKLLFYVAYGEAGVAKLDWSDPANPILMEHQQTVGEATGTAIAHGRVYVADGGGGLVIFRP
ncbi:hypothetical protein BKP64_03455 [Marinobacter salinus]|uniref:LVIVD repeat-containing protein n=1 Tax=Marinobacter salinus TaxID=1874317 RepID=A0A1D9GI49_9GAMM|nr:hypothetical protein [Marinobacter salinus]AOY87317.1 hypothetical protein BKP64_03455 [Marinobacter salinus]